MITTHETLFVASCFAICDKVVSGVAISVIVDMYSDTFMIDAVNRVIDVSDFLDSVALLLAFV